MREKVWATIAGMHAQHVVTISFSMSCQRRAASLRSHVARASTSFIVRGISEFSFSNLPILPDPRLRWVEATGVTNVRAPIELDPSNPVWPVASADGIICINMIHISPWQATVGLIKGAGAILASKLPLYVYGPSVHTRRFPNNSEQPSL